MNKFFIISTLILITSLPLSAQKLQLGLRIGGEISSMSGFQNRKPLLGGHLGGILRFPISEKHRIQTELLLFTRGIKTGNFGFKNSSTNLYLDLPILYNIKLTKTVYAEAGIQGALLLGKFYPISKNPFGFDPLFEYLNSGTRKMDALLVLGTGIEIGKFQIGIRGMYGLINQNNFSKDFYRVVDVNDPIYQEVLNTKVHAISLSLTAGILF